MQRLKPIKITQSKEKLSNRIGLPLVWEIIEKLKLRKEIDRLFGKPGSNRGIKASYYVLAIINMLIDGAIHLKMSDIWRQTNIIKHYLKNISCRDQMP
jgi:hypothetical protein